MSAYPMTIRTLSMHQATKSYHLTLVTTADGKSLFIRRWGKKGAFGEVKPEPYSTVKDGERAWDKLDRAKTGGGYRPEGLPRNETANDAAELRSKLGLPVYNKIGKDAINHLDPSIDTSGMREAEPPRVGEDGKLTGEDKPRTVDLSAQIAAQKAADEAEAAKVLKRHPNFGRF
jgi:predicted DNA-binding WGR domain protein